MATNEDNRVYLFRLQILLIDGGLLLLRTILDQRLLAQGTTFDACLNNERVTIRQLRSGGKITQAQYDVLFPSGGVVPTTSDLDITLIICLLRNLKCVGLNKRFNWSITPVLTDISLEADIWRLKDCRNKICHISTTTGVQPTDFTKSWNDIEQILVRQSPSVLNIYQIITDFKTCPLDAHEETRLQKEIKKWEGYEAKVDRLEVDVKIGQEHIKKGQEDIKVLKGQVDDIQIRQNKAEQSNQGITYPRKKKELKEKLMQFYKKKRSTVPLSPLVGEISTPLTGFYVMPDMVLVEQTSLTCHQEERTPVKSLRDLIITGSEEMLEIYLSADAGFGKTSFSKYLALAWCQACCPDKNRKCFTDEEIKALSNFDFLFLILLRDCTNVCSVDDMIEQQIIKKLSGSQYPIQEILDREKCLIILDGLDEWTHPVIDCPDKDEKIPHRYARDNCVILTTTRPWKLGILNLKTSDINKKVELLRLSEKYTNQLERNAISKMRGVKDDDELRRKTTEFHQDIVSRGLEDMQTIPLLLMYITCLWCNKIPIGNSKVEVYINIIEFLLSRTAQKHPDVHPSSETSHGDIPEYLKNHKFCQKFYSFLLVLAELAYNTLFKENRENKLVFDQCVAEIYLKADDMKLSLLSGILTGSTTANLIERSAKVSFSHKTVQELFAAIYISSHSDGQKTLVEKCTNVQSILDMSMICEFLSITNYEMIDEILAVCKAEFDKCRTVQSILNMSAICEFLSKVNSKMICEISAGLMSVINEEEKTRNYRTPGPYMYYRKKPLYHIQKMFVSCLKQMPESENIKLCFQDFFINEDTIHDENLRRLSKQNQTNMKSLYIDIRHTDDISFRDVIALFSLTDSSNLQTLCYRDNWNNKEADLSLLLSENLQHVQLLDARWTNYEGNLCERITALKHVQYIDISEVTLCHEIRSILYDFISNNKTIKQLKLVYLDCKEHGYDLDDCTGNFDLSIKHSQLEKLELKLLPPLNLTVTSQSLVDVKLRAINLGESSSLLSRDMFNIKRVKLLYIEISAERFRDLINVLEKLPQSVTVGMIECDIKPETEYEHVRNYIRSSQKFDVTQDRKDEYGQVLKFQTTTSCDM